MKNEKKRWIWLTLLLALVLVLTGCGGGEDPADDADPGADTGGDTNGVELNVSAAASLTDALEEIKAEYADESNDIITFNFAASGTLQKQIAEGAPCDLFLSASKEHMDALEMDNMIDTATRKDLLGNALTLIARTEKADAVTIENLATADIQYLAIGTPESVPAGRYAWQSLESLGIRDAVQDKLVFAKDVREVLNYVETGNADCGLVYRSDAMLLKTGEIIGDMPADSHDPIVYPAALITGSENQEAARAFYDFLQTDYAAGVFERYGFTVR